MPDTTISLICELWQSFKLTENTSDDDYDPPELCISVKDLGSPAADCMTCSMIYESLKGLIGENIENVHEVKITGYPDQPLRIRLCIFDGNEREDNVVFELWQSQSKLT